MKFSGTQHPFNSVLLLLRTHEVRHAGGGVGFRREGREVGGGGDAQTDQQIGGLDAVVGEELAAVELQRRGGELGGRRPTLEGGWRAYWM